VARKFHRRISVSGIAEQLKNGYVSHPEAPTEMAAMHNLGGEYVELAVV
jgi:hypothetical protein